MGFRRRIESLERRLGTPIGSMSYPNPLGSTGRPLLAGQSPLLAMIELDRYIQRLKEHIHLWETDPEAFVEGYDDARYGGESIDEHGERVDALLRESDERHEAKRRRRSQRSFASPDLGDVPNELDERIAELRAEIAAEEGGGG